MANQPISMNKLKQVLRLHFGNKNKLQISTATGLSRNTVKKYLSTLHTLNLSPEDVDRLSSHDLDMMFCVGPAEPLNDRLQTLFSFFEEHDRKLRQRGFTRLKLFELYRGLQTHGFGISAFYKYHKLWKRRTQPDMHINHKAGDKLYVDFAGEQLHYVDAETNDVRHAQVFVSILGASQLTYVEATQTQGVVDFITCCEHALHYFGGAPLAIVTDNLKAAVTQSNRYEPKINENFEAFAEHYRMSVLPARAYKPKDKALVEGMVKIVYTRIYAGLPQTLPKGLNALNALIRELVDALNNAQLKGRNCSRRDQFTAMEQQALQPLPEQTFELRSVVYATAAKNGHVCLTGDKHYYSVPYQFIGKKTRILYNTEQVEIYYRYECIATHKRSRTPYNYTTDARHMASSHKILSEWSPEYFLQRAQGISPSVESYIRHILDRRQHPEQAYKACQGILSFAKRFGNARLINACKRAHAWELYGYKHLEQILLKNLDTLEPDVMKLDMPLHENIRGKHYYESLDSSTIMVPDHE